MAGVSLKQGADLIGGMISVPEDTSPAAEPYRRPLVRREDGSLSLTDGASLVQDIVAGRKNSKIVPLNGRRSAVSKGRKRHLSVEEGAKAIEAVIAPRVPAKAKDKAPTREEIVAQELRQGHYARVAQKWNMLAAGITHFLGFIELVQQEFPNLNSFADTAYLVNRDPIMAAKFSEYRRVANLNLELLERCLADVEADSQAYFDEWAVEEDRKFQEANPDLDEGLASAALDLLRSGGLTDENISRLYYGRHVVPLTSPDAQQVILEAAMWRAGRQFEGANERFAAAFEMMIDIGFSTQELEALAKPGTGISMRDHRVQQMIADAARYRMAKKEEAE